MIYDNRLTFIIVAEEGGTYMARAGLVFGLLAVLAFLASLFIPGIGIFLAPLAVGALGWGAGYTAAKTTGAAPGQGAGRGAGAGAIAGLISLIGLIALLLVLFNIPLVRDAIQGELQNTPGAEGISAGAAGSAAALIIGLFCGFINFLLSTIGGLIGGLMWKGAPTSTAGDYVAAGRSTDYGTTGTGYGSTTGTGYGSTDSPYDTGGTTGTGYGSTGTTGTDYGTTGTGYGSTGTTDTGYGSTGTTGTGYGTTGDNPPEGEGGVRVYDSDDRNRT
jgi:hypothetical protein